MGLSIIIQGVNIFLFNLWCLSETTIYMILPFIFEAHHEHMRGVSFAIDLSLYHIQLTLSLILDRV
jgi:hypothetical protein